jgi:protein-L-isoaspartate(D-aspartate) O-methyltransferase
MAYRAVGRNNKDLILALRANGVLKSKRVEEAMLAVDRGEFSADLREAYADHPHSIGYGATISAPHMHIVAMQQLEHLLKPGAKVLDVGSGSGYLVACFSKMMEDKGKVIGIDYVKPLVEWSIKNMRKSHGGLLEKGIIRLKLGDGWKGDLKNAPFDAIHVGAAAETVPKALIDQLALGGRLLIPVDHKYSSGQNYLQIDKLKNGAITQTNLMGVQYVRLVHPKEDFKEEDESDFPTTTTTSTTNEPSAGTTTTTTSSSLQEGDDSRGTKSAK